MRKISKAEKEIWGEKGELCTYLKNVQSMIKNNRKKKKQEKSG